MVVASVLNVEKLAALHANYVSISVLPTFVGDSEQLSGGAVHE